MKNLNLFKSNVSGMDREWIENESGLTRHHGKLWKHVAMIFAVLVMSIANIGMAWGADCILYANSSGSKPSGTNSSYTGITATFNSFKDGTYTIGTNDQGFTHDPHRFGGSGSGKNVTIVISAGYQAVITVYGQAGSTNKYMAVKTSDSGASSSDTYKTKLAATGTVYRLQTETLSAGTYYVKSDGDGVALVQLEATVTSASSGKNIYLKPNGIWDKDGARFAAYYFKSSGSGDGWVDFASYNACTPCFKATIPSGYDRTIICRMDGSKAANNWDNKWNQTLDLTVPTGNDTCYTISSINGCTDGKSCGSWGTYTAPTYTISFNGNGSTSGSTSSHTGIACNGSQTLRANGFTRTGWTFTGWNTDKYGKGTAYAAGATVSAITSNITLYAQWEKEIYLKMGSGWADANAWFAIYYYDSGADSNNGWVKMNLAESCSDPAVYKATVPGNGYNTIIFVRKNPADMTVPSWSNKWNQTTNQSLPTSNNQFTITGGSGDSYTGSWGTYSAPTSTVTYNGNGSTGGSVPTDGSSPYACGSTVTVKSNTGSLERTGYNFVGWNTAANGSGTSYTAGNTFTISANTTLYAKWEAVKYTVTYNVNGGGSVTPTSATQASSGASVTLPTPTWSGYTFDGWYSAGAKIGNGGASYTPTADITLYAHWTDNISGKVFSFIDNNYGDKFKAFDLSGWVTGDANNKDKTHTNATTGVSYVIDDATWENKSMAVAALAKFKGGTTKMSVVIPTGKIATVKISYGAYGTGASDYSLTVNGTSQTNPSTKLTNEMTNAQVISSMKEITLNNQTGTLTLGISNTSKSLYVGRVSAVITGYTVSYAAGTYGSGSLDSGTKTAGSSFTLSSSSSAFTRSGYVYDGWSINEDGNTKDYNLGGSYTADAAITLYPHWVADCTAPTSVNITGTYHYFPGETISLTAAAEGGSGTPTTYQWYKGGTADGNAIDGATSATFTKSNCVVGDAGDYYCKVTCGGSASRWSDGATEYTPFKVKIMQFLLKDSNGDDIGDPHALVKGADAQHASLILNLTGGTTYKFRVTDGCGNWYGNSDATGMTSSNCTNWTMPHNADCKMTTGLKTANYTFNFDFTSGLLGSEMKVSIVYPGGNQAADKVIYWDNSVLNWDDGDQWYRIGKSNHHSKTQMTKVFGTANLYKVTTAAYDGFEYWHIANNDGNGTGNLFWTKGDAAHAITNAMAFEGAPVTADAITITPTTSHATGETTDNDNCEFYTYGQTPGMKRDRVTITAPVNGTITVNYTSEEDVASSFSATTVDMYQDLAHTVILTSITATPNTGYDAGAITINGGAYSANYVVTGNTTIAATFSPHVYTITLDKGDHGAANQSATVAYLAGELTSIAHVTSTGYTLTGYYDGETKVLNANGTFAGANVTGYITDSKWTRTSDATLTAKWTAKTTTITIDANTGNHGSSTPGNVTATFGSALPSFTAAAGVSGWNLTGYFTAPTSGTKVINADGTLVRNTTYATDESTPKWKYETATLTLYPQYEEEADACYEFTPATSGSAPSKGDVINGTGTGGTMVAGTGQSYTANGLKFESSGDYRYVTVTLDNNLKEGSVIAVTMWMDGTSENRGLNLQTSAGTQKAQWKFTADSENHQFSYTVEAGDGLINTNVFRLARINNVYLKTVTVSNCGDAVCTTPATAFANGAYTVGGSALDLSTLISGKQGSGAITYTVKNANGTGAAIASTSFTATSAGTATVTATQAADATYCEKVMDATITVSAAPAGGDCDMYVWFADPTTDNGGAANTDKFTTYPTASASNMTGSFIIDEVTYSVTKRRQVGSGSTIAAFTVPTNHTGIYYAIIGSTGTGTRTIYLKQGETTIQTMTDAVAGSSSTGSNVTIENIAPGSYTITANSGTNVGFMGLKLCDVEACSAPTITVQPTNSADKTLGETVSFSLTATGADSYQWYRCNSSGDEMVVLSSETANSLSFTAAMTGTAYYRCRALKDCGMSVLSNVVSVSVTPIEFTIHYTAGVASGTTYTTETFTASKEVNDAVETYIAESSLSKYTFTGVTFPAGANGQMSNQISMPAEYDANKYVSFTFDVASNYQIQLTNIDLQVRSSANTAENQNFKIVVSDAYGHLYTKESLSVADQSDKVQIGGDIDDATHFVGTVTVKLYGWTSDDKAYRINKDIYITGEVSSLPAPTASWTARPASATVGDGGKTYTLTTDGTNTVAWSITDQSGATDAALSPTSGLTTTLDDYSAAGSLYVQASVTGDGIHYLSTPATLLRQRVVISADCEETTLISATLSSCTGTGAVTGTTGGTSAVSFESCESIDGGYKMGKDDSYMRLALSSGNFEANDEVKITITKASDQGDGALHIYKYASSEWTELGSVVAAGAGTYSYTLTETNVSTAFNTIGLYRTEKNQNPYVKALSVVRNSCSASKPSGVTVTASPAGPYAIGATPTLTVTADNANTYQWYSNTNNTASDGFLLVGETAATYSPSTAIAGTTYYYCVATNASGSTVSNIITVTVNSAKTAPTVSWTDTYETPNYGGGGYAVKATVSTAEWDGTLTTDMLTASDGVTLTGVSVSGKVITATYGVTETARSPLSFSLTLPETTNYTALAANKEITFTRCGEGEVIGTTETKLPVRSSYTTASNPTYRWETDGVGWFTLETGASSISSESSSYSGFSNRSKSGKKYVLLYSELDAVKAVRLYVNGTGDNTTLSKVRTGTTYNKYKELTESTDYDFTYSNSSTSIASRENAYIEISFKTNLTANTFVEITLSRNTLYYGVELLTGSTEVGTIDTDISWATDPGTTVNKKTTDANFRYEAVKAPDAASQATLGTISYKSSVPAVATVSATGVVDVLSEGTTTITATLAGSGCYKKATLSYNLVVAAATCTDVAGTITASGSGITIDGNTVTKADACAAVSLTVSGHTGENDGATYQWYKDGVSMGVDYRSKSISVNDNGDYTVEVTNAGDGHCTMPATNTITITGNAISITKIVDEWYVKNDRRTPDIALATIEGTTSYTVNDGSSNITTFAGCGFELRDGILYLKGTQDDGSAPSGLAAGDVTLTITAVSACGDDPTATITIHKQVKTAKRSIAFIVDGTKGDPVNSVATTKTSSRPIWIYLSEFFDLTGCNAYWTNNEKLIRQYYSQFDAIVITDDPSTDEKPKSGLKYVNALGTMVDVRPILTMEAYVGKYGASSNWHIGGTPSSPNPRQYELKLQCKDHDIFSDLTPSANFRSEEIDGETYYYVTMVDNSVTPYAGLADDAETETYPALQGFSAASIKGTGLLGIGTISDGTLQGGVERQDEPAARMMILGIQHQAMAALTSEGKQVIKNAINYLLKTDMEEVDDCSNYFIGGTVGHEQEWHTASNWSSTKVPDASTKARIMAPVTISTTVHVAQVDIAVDGRSIHYNSGNTNCSGSVTIASTGALIVEGQVRRTTNGRLFTEDELEPTTPADLTIQTSSSAQGALIFDNSDGETQATVVVRSKANKDEGTRNWQYLTSPLQETPVTEFFYGVGTYTYKHSEADGGWVRYNLGTTFHAFDAIGLTQEAAKDFVFYGPLAPTGEWNLSLTHARSGNNLFGNSWTAPIDLKALVRNTDFDGNIDLDLAIYNTGADQKNGSGEFVQAANADNTPGTWHHVPLELATLEAAGWMGLKVIPAYQAFQLKVKDGASSATLTIDYDKCVRGTESANYNEPLRAPRRRSAGRADSDIEALRLAVSDAKGIAYIYLLEGEQFTEGYDNGWELAYKADSKYGKLYAISPEQGNMMALARPSLEGTMVGFQPGESSEYTITFNETDGYYYLNDLKMEQSTLIQAGESYTFSVEEGESANRFLISSVPFDKPGIVTGVTNPNAEAPKAQKVIYNDKLYIIRGGKVFSADGQLVK